LEVATDVGIRSLAFPAISCGVYGYPFEQAAAVAVHEVADFLASHPDITKVVLAAFDSQAETAINGAMDAEPLLRGTSVDDEPRSALTDGDKQMLLSLARQTLSAHLEGQVSKEVGAGSDAVEEHRPAFVTLRRKGTGELRGCIGEVVAQRPLVQSVARMAVAAGTDDPRFPPVSAEELRQLTFEISALTPMTPIQPDEVRVGKHGLMISRGRFSGLLLPQVPVEQGWNREEYLRGLCQKAGLPSDAWKADDVEIRSFEAEVWGEED
jgi:AmmeMemoRadiSam system protein A